MTTTYTIKINKYVQENNPRLPVTCGHKHRSLEAAENCRCKLTHKLRLAWTDATIEEVKS